MFNLHPNIPARVSLYVMTTLMTVRWWCLYITNPEIHQWSNVIRPAGLLIAAFTIWLIVLLRKAGRDGRLATQGPYRFVAHPAYVMYVTMDVPLWFLVTHDLFAVSTGIAFYVSIAVTMYLEEKALLFNHGEMAKVHLARTLSIHRFTA